MTQAGTPGGYGARRGGRLLLVDDSEDDRVLTEAALRRAGFIGELEFARDGMEALDALLGPPAQRRAYDAVLLDINLPRLTGLEVLERVRNQGVQLPIIVVSTSRQPAEIQRALDLGANEYVPKDVDFVECCRAMRGLCERWLPG